MAGPGAFAMAVGLVLGLRFFLFISRYAVNVLFWDQWDYLDRFFDGDPGFAEVFFLQHGPHRLGLGLIATKFLYPLTDWNVRCESFMIGGCIFVAMLLALLLKKRLFGRLDYSDAFIPAMFLTLAQYETVIGTPIAAHSTFPLLLTMLYGLALLRQNYLWRYGLVLLVNVLSIYTGFGVFMGAITIGLFALFCYWRWRGVISVPPVAPISGLLVACASLASFFVNYEFQPAVDCFEFPYHRLVDYPRFVALMFSTFTGIRSPTRFATILGMAILLPAIFILGDTIRRAVRAEVGGQVHLMVAILLGYSMLFAANTAVGRVCLGLPAAAQASRYATLLIPAFLAMYLYLRALHRKVLREIALGLLALVLMPGLAHVSGHASWYADGKRTWVSCYKRTEDIGYCDSSTGFAIYPDAERRGLKQKLDYLKNRKLNLFAE